MMRQWSLLLGGLVVWAFHFFALYIVASVFPGAGTARWLTAAVTLPALAADGIVLWIALHRQADDLDRWIRRLGSLGAVLSLVAVLWQALPAILI